MGKMLKTYRELQSGYQLISHQKLYKPESNGSTYLKRWLSFRFTAENQKPEFWAMNPALKQMLYETL